MTTSVLFFGTPHFALPTLKALFEVPEMQVVALVTQPDRPAGRGKKVASSPIKEFGVTHHIPVLQPVKLRGREDEFIEAVKPFGPIDIGVVIAFGQILPARVLSLPKYGCVNIHASLLPRWRGAAPIQRAILAGDRETGVCVMHMEAGLDTGPVYARSVVPIKDEETGGSLHDRLSVEGASLLVENIVRIVRGEISAIPQENEGVTYAEKITSQEAGLDWTLDATQLERAVRAFNPVPGAYTYWKGIRLKVFKAEVVDMDAASQGVPGTIVQAASGRIMVACGRGVLALRELQLEGRKRLAVEDFLKGNAPSRGDCLTVQC